MRVSDVGGREGESYISIPIQREAIEAYATELKGEIVEWFTDEDFTGGNTDRPGFQAALKKIWADEADGIVVWKVDRFGRSVADGVRIVRELVGADKVFASCSERIDPRTPEGKFALTAFFANAELFLDQSKAGWIKAKIRAVARGAPIGATPFGYLRVKAIPTKPNHISTVDAAALTGKQPEPGTLVVDPVTGPMITEMFQRAAAGANLTELANGIDDPERTITTREIRRWLTSRIYLGEIHYGSLSSKGLVPALTDPATFEAADPGEIRGKRPTVALPLVGLIRCANCREVMAGNTYGGSDHNTPIYRCGSGCGNGSVMIASRVHEYVFGAAREEMRGHVLAASRVNMAELDAAVEKAEAELDAFVSNLAVRAAIGEAKWEAGIKLRAEALATAKRVRDEALAADQFHTVDLENPSEAHLCRFAFVAMGSVFIKRGRGVPADRIVIAWGANDIEL